MEDSIEFKNGFDEKRVRMVWDPIDGMPRKYMWNSYVEMWIEV